MARFETIRLILSLAAQSGWVVYQFDVKSAFLNGVLEEEVYVEQPLGFIVKGSEEKVYRLHKALYGLKQAPRAWYSRIDGYLVSHGYNRSMNEPTMYTKEGKGTDFIVICVYVDDIIYTGSSQVLIEEFKKTMVDEFDMTYIGKLQYFLGLEVDQKGNGIFLSQRKYAIDLLKKFCILTCKAAVTPMNANDKFVLEDGSDLMDEYRYRSLVGGLMYLTHTRPDIGFAVGIISRFMHKPTVLHFGAAKRILRYIAGSVGYDLWYEMKNASVFFIGSGVVSWSSKKQAVVALSTTEAEYVSAAAGACQTVLLRKMLQKLKIDQKEPTTIWCDNRSAVFMINNQAFHSRTKHISIKFHYNRSLLDSGEIQVKSCDTKGQVADIFTKALGAEKFLFFRTQLGLCDRETLN
ncbi:hypothetical protein E3N88_06953 [Mikania micrantha]|uniref:Reverse transcriptase Ty1/copia-type domain-containing protein n=1 Tax=Mikania micrantha TaxID=192012 RepID=A0A5N6PS87_9ASTR|nr:hypothetical protein E3N88_06953 [Mikania micrantha]